jgi:hypothetical protein
MRIVFEITDSNRDGKRVERAEKKARSEARRNKAAFRRAFA